MISRRRIISRSHEVLSDTNHGHPYDFEDNVWHSKEKLFRDHIQEILNKWEQIDDEIWAKIICMEKNRRVAKAYARAQVISINGSELGFDGYRIGLNGFQNPKRDINTEDVKKYIGSGAKLKIDDEGNIHIKRVGKSGVFVNTNTVRMAEFSHSTGRTNCLPMMSIETDKSLKLFDMKKFQTNVYKEMRNSYPDRRKLEMQCISCVAFVKEQNNILEHPIWVMLINIVALDLLKSKFPSLPNITAQLQPKFMTIFEHQIDDKMPNKSNYKLNDRYMSQTALNNASTDSTLLSSCSSSSSSAQSSSRREPSKLFRENENFTPTSLYRNQGMDDLYYCGLEARVPNYGRQRSSIAICANNSSSVDLRKYFDSPMHLSSLPPDLSATHRQTTNYGWSDDSNNLESLDMFAGRDSIRKKYLAVNFQNSIELNNNKYCQQKDVSLNPRLFTGQWK